MSLPIAPAAAIMLSDFITSSTNPGNSLLSSWTCSTVSVTFIESIFLVLMSLTAIMCIFKYPFLLLLFKCHFSFICWPLITFIPVLSIAITMYLSLCLICLFFYVYCCKIWNRRYYFSFSMTLCYSLFGLSIRKMKLLWHNQVVKEG